LTPKPAANRPEGTASMPLFAENRSAVKAELVRVFADQVDEILDLAHGVGDLRSLEKAVVAELLCLGRLTLGHLFALRCQQAAAQDIEQRGLTPEQVRLRFDEDYWATVVTTVGPVHFPWFAYRDLSRGHGTVTRTPARKQVLPYQRSCHSSPLCLEWEVRLGAQHPYRGAQEELQFFTHGAVTLEDTTISRHLLRVSTLVDRSWMYLSPEEIREILREQATRDRETRKPIIYASCDAHALRQYVNETWETEWKMANGIRLWCEDRKTGEIIHLGGEFTWGDCHEVSRVFQALIDEGILPADGNYGEGVRAQLAWVSDAMRWFDDHILKLFADAVVILDIFHLLRWFAICAAKTFKAGSKTARQMYAWAARVLGFGAAAETAAKPRKGHKKRRGRKHRHAHNAQQGRFKGIRKTASGLAVALLDILASFKPKRKEGVEELEALAERICNNTWRMNYPDYIRRGYQIGSGAMESFHRTGSQQRTKVPGARWLAETSQAVFNLRMVQLVGKWDAFWEQPGLLHQLADALPRKPVDASAGDRV
jgi:hypothetical protein